MHIPRKSSCRAKSLETMPRNLRGKFGGEEREEKKGEKNFKSLKQRTEEARPTRGAAQLLTSQGRTCPFLIIINLARGPRLGARNPHPNPKVYGLRLGGRGKRTGNLGRCRGWHAHTSPPHLLHGPGGAGSHGRV